jgi:uncharacterized protein with ACT and thioredoxin-like domain
MKVYGLPEEIKYQPDYSKFDYEAERQREETAKAELKAWLQKEGYTGPLTGEIASFGQGDGYANYMFADAGRRSCLIHLPFGDAWQLPYIERLTKADIVKKIQQQKNMKAIFGRK